MIVCIERDKYGDEPNAYYVVEISLRIEMQFCV